MSDVKQEITDSIQGRFLETWGVHQSPSTATRYLLGTPQHV